MRARDYWPYVTFSALVSYSTNRVQILTWVDFVRGDDEMRFIPMKDWNCCDEGVGVDNGQC